MCVRSLEIPTDRTDDEMIIALADLHRERLALGASMRDLGELEALRTVLTARRLGRWSP